MQQPQAYGPEKGKSERDRLKQAIRLIGTYGCLDKAFGRVRPNLGYCSKICANAQHHDTFPRA
jgi:hypothetical protein